MEGKGLTIYYDEAVTTTENGKTVTNTVQKVRCKVPKWTFQDKAMAVGEQYITFNFESPYPVSFAAGDYCTYRGMKFYLTTLPSVQQDGRKSGDTMSGGKTGNAFKYDNVRLDSDSEKLGRAIMLDIVPTSGDHKASLGTNYTGSAQFQLNCVETTTVIDGKTVTRTAVCTLADKIKANLDRAFPDDGWQVHVNLTSYETKYGKQQLVTHTDSKVLSFDNTLIANALAEVNNTFDIDYFVRGRDIYIGYTLSAITADDKTIGSATDADNSFFYFGYGKGYADKDNQGRALFEIKKSANQQQNVITRLRALGSTRNMPYRYYNKKYDLSQSLFPQNLQLPDTFETPAVKAANNKTRKESYSFLRAVKGDTNDAYLDKNDDALSTKEGLREACARWDGSDSNLEEIYPTIKEGTYRDLRAAVVTDSDGYTEKSTVKMDGNGKHSFLNYLDDERVDEILAVGYLDGDGNLIDDASKGDGIDDDPSLSSRNLVKRNCIVKDTSIIVSESSLGATEKKVLTTTLFSIDDQYAGSYTLSPSSYHVWFGLKYGSNTAGSVRAYYKMLIYVTPKSTGVEALYGTYKSDILSSTNTSTTYTETELPALPDVINETPQIEKITLTEVSSVRVEFQLFMALMGDKDISSVVKYFVGKSKVALKLPTDYISEYLWSPVSESKSIQDSPFHIIIKDMGFSLAAQFNGNDKPCVEMSDGYCGGRKFEISDDVKEVTYTKNGKQYKGYQLRLTRDADTSLHTYYPNDTTGGKLQAGDHYVLTGIQMPDVYVKMAEFRLLVAATQYLADNCETKYTYEPSLDNIYLARNYDKCKAAGDVTKSVYWNLYAGMKFPFRGLPETNDPDEVLPYANITIESLSIKEEDGYTPQVEMTLNDDIEQSTYNKVTTAVDRIYNGSLMSEFLQRANTENNSSKLISLIRSVGAKYFLSSASDDTASGVITFLKGLLLGDGTHGIDKDGAARLASLLINGQYGIDSTGKGTLAALENSGDIRNTGGITTRDLTVTGAAHFFKLVIDEIKSAGGSLILTPANGFVTEKVIHTDGDTHYKLLWKASDGQKSITNMWMAGDQAICMTDNLAAGTTYNASNRFWWVLVTDAGATTVEDVRYNYITVNFDRSKDANAVSAGTPADIVPKVGDNVAMLGSRATDKDSGEVLTDRQNAVYIAAHGSLDTGLTAPFMAFYRGITTFDLKKYRKTHFAPNSSAVIANNFLMTGDDYEAPVTTYLGEWTTGMIVPYGGVVSYNGRTWTCINPKGADGIEPTKQATAYWASNKGDSYDIAFSLNGVHVDTLNYDDVKAMESASLQVDFLNDGDPYTAAKATITCYDASGAVLGSPIELTDTTSDIIDGGNLYLSKDCKQITAVAYDAAGRQVVSKSLGVIRNGVDGTELVSLMLKVISGHTSWRAGQGTIATVAAYAMKGGYDITDAQDVSQFIWIRDSSDTTGDKNWNSQHTTGSKTLSVAEGDMVGDFTTFVCTLYNKNGKVVEAQKLDFQL